MCMCGLRLRMQSGWAALGLAAFKGRTEVVTELLKDIRLDVNLQDQVGNQGIHTQGVALRRGKQTQACLIAHTST